MLILEMLSVVAQLPGAGDKKNNLKKNNILRRNLTQDCSIENVCLSISHRYVWVVRV